MKNTMSILQKYLALSLYLTSILSFCISVHFQVMSLCTTRNLSIAAWNMRCMFDISKPYMQHLARKADIIAISEHGLYPCELYKLESILQNYTCLAKPSAQLSDENFMSKKGIGGCAILWNKKSLTCKVKPHYDVGDDRICLTEIHTGDHKMFLIAVYMPHQSCKIANFMDELRKIEDILNEYMPKGDCIIIGDINVDFSQSHGNRCSGKPSTNGDIFINTMKMYDMVIADIGTKGKGPSYSFSGGHGTSYLDHVVVPASFMKCVKNCVILPDCDENVSDHLAIILNTELVLSVKYSVSSRKQIKWHTILNEDIESKYTEPLEVRCRDIFLNAGFDPDFICMLPEYCGCDSAYLLEKIIDEITSAMIETGLALPHSMFNKALKPYWNENLNQLNKNKKHARKEWVNSGKSRDKDDINYKLHLTAKRNFRCEQRKRVYEYECNEIDELVKAEDMNQMYFWYLVNKRKHKKVRRFYLRKGCF